MCNGMCNGARGKGMCNGARGKGMCNGARGKGMCNGARSPVDKISLKHMHTNNTYTHTHTHTHTHTQNYERLMLFRSMVDLSFFANIKVCAHNGLISSSFFLDVLGTSQRLVRKFF